MTNKVVALLSEGKVYNVVVAEPGATFDDGIDITGLVPQPGIGWDFDGETWTPPEDAPPAPPPTTTRMTHFKFLSRFTPQQRLEIRRRTNESHPSYDETLDDAIFLFNSARDIDVSLEMTQNLVGYMAMIGLVPPGDVPTLLAPIGVDEDGALPQ